MLVDACPRVHEDVAQHFLGLVLVSQDAKGEPEHPGRELIVQLRQRRFVVRLQAGEQGPFFLLTETPWLAHLDFLRYPHAG